MSYLCLRKQRKILNKRAMAIIDENIRGKVGNSVFNAGEECGSELLGCEYDKTTGKPFPFESSNTFLSAFGGDRVTGGMVSGDSRNREKWVQFLFEIKHDGF